MGGGMTGPVKDQSTPQKPRVLLADDHVLVAQCVKQMLEAEADCEVVGLVADGRALVAEAERLKPDVAIVDITLPLLNGLDACRVLKQLAPDLKLIALTMHADERFVRAAFQIGCAAYVVKQDMSGELVRALTEVLHGGTYLSPTVARSMAHRAAAPLHPVTKNGALELSPRQRQIVQLLAQGKTIKDIAEALDLSLATVEHQTKRIKQRLGLRSTDDLAGYALRNGLIALH
jgi:DNA-binding NarL/FixJ family response regulator